MKNRLIEALKLDVPYFERSWNQALDSRREKSTEASVLLLLGTARARGGEPELLMTRRTETVEKHKGQMAFPGGANEAGETSARAALRETSEEVGIAPEAVDVIGELPGLWTPTGFWITPVVGILKTDIEETLLSYSENEIAEAFWIPLLFLKAEGVYRQKWLEREKIRFATHVYQVGEHRIWGATGAMIKNLLDRLAAFE